MPVPLPPSIQLPGAYPLPPSMPLAQPTLLAPRVDASMPGVVDSKPNIPDANVAPPTSTPDPATESIEQVEALQQREREIQEERERQEEEREKEQQEQQEQSESGETSTSKISRIRNKMQSLDGDYYLVTDLTSIAWLLNIRGNDSPNSPVPNSRLIISKSKKNTTNK